MKVLVFLIILTCASKAKKLMRLDEMETYLSKFVLNNVTKDEEGTLQDLFKILSLPEFVPALLKNKHEIDRPTSYSPNSLINFLRCKACRSILGALFVGVRLGLSDERLIKIATRLCVVFKIQTRNVCRGAVELNLEPITMQSYSYNMTEANLHPNRRPHWFQLYDLNKSFHLPDLSPASIGNLVNLMSSGSHYLDLYSAYYSKVSDVRWPQCDQECKINNLCNIVITVLWDRKKCEEITRLLCANATLIL